MDQNFIKIFMRSNFIVGVFYCVTILGMERSEKNNAEVAFNTLKTHFCAYYASEKLNNAYQFVSGNASMYAPDTSYIKTIADKDNLDPKNISNVFIADANKRLLESLEESVKIVNAINKTTLDNIDNDGTMLKHDYLSDIFATYITQNIDNILAIPHVKLVLEVLIKKSRSDKAKKTLQPIYNQILLKDKTKLGFFRFDIIASVVGSLMLIVGLHYYYTHFLFG